MAQDAANHINYFLLIGQQHKEDLAGIRQWNNLKIAFEGDDIWVKDFDYVQINSLEIKSIPYKTIFYSRDGKLCLLNSLLPDRNIPALLWTPVDRALPVTLPSFNHNFFGIQEKVGVHVIPSEKEEEAVAMITTMATLERYLEQAPVMRTERIQWTILNGDKVLLTGTPLLPIDGTTYWMRGDFFIPTGYDFDLFLLSDALNKTLNPDNACRIIWNTDSTCFPVAKQDMQSLSLGSLRSSLDHLLKSQV